MSYSSYILKTPRLGGIAEVAGLYSSGKDSYQAIAHDIVSLKTKCDLVFFTDAVGNRRGASLYNYIRRHKLGTVTQSKPRMNPNSSNRVRVWCFKPDMGLMREMWKKNGLPRYEF